METLWAYDVAHSVSGRQRRSERSAAEAPGAIPYTNASSTISIPNLLEIVKETHQSVLSQDVLNYFKEKKNPGRSYTKRTKFSRDNPTYAELQRQNADCGSGWNTGRGRPGERQKKLCGFQIWTKWRGIPWRNTIAAETVVGISRIGEYIR